MAVVLMGTPAWAHMGACVPAEVGTKVTMCDLGNRTQCIAVVNVPKKKGWIVGRCQGEPTPCGPGECPPDYTVCCTYANGSLITAGSVAECPKTDLKGACLAQVVEAARADANARACVPIDDTGTAGLSPRTFAPLTSLDVPTSRIVGYSDFPLECQAPNTINCCTYNNGATTTVDGTCDNCPDTLPGGFVITNCKPDAYSSGDGQSCIAVQ